MTYGELFRPPAFRGLWNISPIEVELSYEHLAHAIDDYAWGRRVGTADHLYNIVYNWDCWWAKISSLQTYVLR